MKLLRLLPLLPLVAGCMPTAPSPVEGLRHNRHLWEERRPETYEFVLAREACECPAEWLVPTRVIVHQTKVLAAEHVGTGLSVAMDAHHVMTVDQLFELVEAAFQDDAVRVEVTYDLEFGYPSSIFIDYRANLVDEEVGISARELKAVEIVEG